MLRVIVKLVFSTVCFMLFHTLVLGVGLGAPKERTSSRRDGLCAGGRCGTGGRGDSSGGCRVTTRICVRNLNKGRGVVSMAGYTAHLHMSIGSISGMLPSTCFGRGNTRNIIEGKATLRIVINLDIPGMERRFRGLL